MLVWRGDPISAKRMVIIIARAGKEVGVFCRDRISDGRLRRFGGCEAGDVDRRWGFVVIDHHLSWWEGEKNENLFRGK